MVDQAPPSIQESAALDSEAPRRTMITRAIYLVLGLIFTAALLSPPARFCPAELRFPKDHEFFEAAMRSAMLPSNTIKQWDDANTIWREVKGVPYSSLEEFKQRNPHCCEFVNGTDQIVPSSWFAYLMGRDSRLVSVTYAQLYEEGGTTKANPTFKHFRLSDCAKVTAFPGDAGAVFSLH
jgi:hypothetical protein